MSIIFNPPTTKEELHRTIQNIDTHYRLSRSLWQDLDLQNYNIQKINFIPKTDEELLQIATEMLSYKQSVEKQAKYDEYENALIKLNSEKAKLSFSVIDKKQAVNDRYDALIISINEDAVKKGIMRSDITISQIADAEENRSKELLKIDEDFSRSVAVIDGEIAGIEQKLDTLEERFEALNALEITAKQHELKEKQQKDEIEALKYNNQIEETLTKNANNITQIKRKYQLQHEEISMTPITDEELYVLGYYNDMALAIQGYYNNIPAEDAYVDCRDNGEIKIYLGNYYNNMLTSLRARMND